MGTSLAEVVVGGGWSAGARMRRLVPGRELPSALLSLVPTGGGAQTCFKVTGEKGWGRGQPRAEAEPARRLEEGLGLPIMARTSLSRSPGHGSSLQRGETGTRVEDHQMATSPRWHPGSIACLGRASMARNAYRGRWRLLSVLIVTVPGCPAWA